MKKFATFTIISNASAEKISDLAFPDEWCIEVMDDPSTRFWDSKNGKGALVSSQKPSAEEIARNKETYIPSKCLIVITGDEQFSEIANDLLFASNILIHPMRVEKFSISSPLEIKPDNEFNFGMLSSEYVKLEFGYLTMLTAINAFKSENLMYAIMKYKLSLSLDWFTPHSAHPRYGQVFNNYFASYEYHVDAGFAINAAYSILEEIQMEIRTSAKSPTWNEDKTDFNPNVRKNLDLRINQIGLNSHDKYTWIIRGEITEINKTFEPNLGVRTDPESEIIYDEEVELIEAIQRSRYIRNFITAHKFTEISKFLSPYDVFNVQTLTRKILLHKLGVWGILNTPANIV